VSQQRLINVGYFVTIGNGTKIKKVSVLIQQHNAAKDILLKLKHCRHLSPILKHASKFDSNVVYQQVAKATTQSAKRTTKQAILSLFCFCLNRHNASTSITAETHTHSAQYKDGPQTPD